MAGVQDLVKVSETILNVTKAAVNLLQDWGTVTIDYESKLYSLERMIYLYEKVMGMPICLGDRDSMMNTLKEAHKVLEQEQETLQRLHVEQSLDSSQWWDVRLRLRAYFTVYLFPGKLDHQLQRVTEKFDELAKNLNSATTLAEQTKKWAEHRAILTTTLNNDQLYVPISKSQNEVIALIDKGIEKPDGQPIGKPIVLLHGGVGKGKSTLARYVCFLYANQDTKAATKLFDHVIPVLCGNSTNLDPWTKQSEILQRLSPSSSGYTAEKNPSASTNARISDDLRQCLMDKKVLVILDDVADHKFLYEMWKAAQGAKCVKYLVTSQHADLCGSLTTHSSFVEMANPNQDEARQILAGLVGLKDRTIPGHLEEIANKMIEATEGNPLALACLASNFPHSCDKENKRAWQDAYKSLCNLLDSPQMKIVIGQNYENPARSSWAAMELCLKNLETEDAKIILLLIYSCKGESVPEAVLRILYNARSRTSATFFKASAELFSRELLKPSPGTLPSTTNSNGEDQNEGKLRKEDWSLKFLVRLYMNQRMAGKEEITTLLGALSGDKSIVQGASVKHNVENARVEEDTATKSGENDAVESEKKKVAIALCALYFDRTHVDKVVQCKAIQARKACNLIRSSDDMNERRRNAIEPIIWLLDQPEDDKWTESNVRCVRQVFIKYVYERKLDDARIADLLKLASYPSAPLATLIAVADIFSIEETTLLNKSSLNFLNVLVDLLASKEHLYIRVAACTALLNISRKAKKERKIDLVSGTPRLLDSLVNSIEESLLGESPQLGSKALAENAEEALEELGYCLHYTSSTKEQEGCHEPVNSLPCDRGAEVDRA